MRSGKVIIISGPSGSGKTTLYKRLLTERNDLVKSISVTTRSKRLGEKHGKDYIFVNMKDFLAMKKKDHFLESQKVFDNYYGTPYKNVRDLLLKGKNVLLCIDVKGAKVVEKKFKDAVKVFIKTSTWAILKKRLESRGSEDPKTVKLRLETAKKELQEAKTYDFVVINHDLEKAYKDLHGIIDRLLLKDDQCSCCGCKD